MIGAENAKKMGIALEDVECGVLSHAHYDHADGMPTFFEINENAKLKIDVIATQITE